MAKRSGNVLLMVLVLGLISLTPVYSAQLDDSNLGRLFTSATERVVLDRHRRQDLLQDHVAQAPTAQVNEEKITGAVVVNGVLKRSNGDKIVWINGKKVKGSKGPDNVRIYRGPDSNNRVVVGVRGKRAVKLGPGQQLRLPDGKVAENYAANGGAKTK